VAFVSSQLKILEYLTQGRPNFLFEALKNYSDYNQEVINIYLHKSKEGSEQMKY
jgi:hypothetical protein